MAENPALAFEEARHHEAAGRLLQAIQGYLRCTAQAPGDPKPWARIGFCLLLMNELAEARATFDTVMRLAPSDPLGPYGQAIALFQAGLQAPALASIEHAAAMTLETDDTLKPAIPWALASSIWSARAFMHASLGLGPAYSAAGYKAWGRRFADPLTDHAEPLPHDRSPSRRLKVGYVSGDLREHAIAYFVEPVLAQHDHHAFEWHAFSTGPSDAVTARLKPMFDHWHDASQLDDEAVYRLVRATAIDILIDLSGHTEGHRLGAFARRAAPVQVTWLGFMYTTGLRAMDYRMTDEGMDPLDARPYYTECLFHMSCMAVFRPHAKAPEIGPLPLHTQGHVHFVSLNGFKKVNDETVKAWAEILRRAPTARLVIVGFEAATAGAPESPSPGALAPHAPLSPQHTRLAALGLPLDRVDLLPRLPLDEFVRLGNAVDIALDTVPVSGGTTTLHALWMGLPVVCVHGAEATHAASACTVHGLGYDQLAATSLPHYIDIAVKLAMDTDFLDAFRQNIRARMQASPLMDYPGFTQEMQRGLRLMWLNHTLGAQRYVHTDFNLEHELTAIAANS